MVSTFQARAKRVDEVWLDYSVFRSFARKLKEGDVDRGYVFNTELATYCLKGR